MPSPSPSRKQSATAPSGSGFLYRRRKSATQHSPPSSTVSEENTEQEISEDATPLPKSPPKVSAAKSPLPNLPKPPRLPDRPVHVSQDSLFSSSSGYSNYRGFLNLAILLLVVSNARVALENVIKYGILVNPLEWIAYVQSNPERYLPFFALLAFTNIFILSAFGLEIWLAAGSLNDRTAAVYYCTSLSFTLILPAGMAMYLRMDPFASCFCLGIYTCVFLKLISYAHVNYWCRYALKATPVGRSSGKRMENGPGATIFGGFGRKETVRYPENLTLNNLYYFMFAPTLCYELNFPRSPKIRWWFVAKRSAESVFLSQVMLGLQQQWIIPLLKNSLQPFIEMDYGRMIERLLKLAIPNLVIWLMFFYWLFHSILNLTAELLRFADREFYRDWWNAETISYFWQAWNVPVHRWCLRHLYKPTLRAGYGKLTAAVGVFVLSAFFHEFLVSVPLCMFRLWAFSGMLAQIPLNVLSTTVLKGGKGGNLVVWGSLILGQPLAILMYVHDWYIMNYGPNLG